MKTLDYWEECLDCAATYIGLELTREQLTALEATLVANHLSYTVQSDDDLRSLAAIKYDNGKPGEGVVVRACDGTWSFKVINLEYRD